MEQAFSKDMRDAEWDKVYERQTRRGELLPGWMDGIYLQPGDRVLEVGCGPGFFTLALAERVGPHGLVYAVDRSADALAYLAHLQDERGIIQVRRIAADAATLGDDLRADCALATMVLHHADDAPALVRNLHRLVRPRALVVFAEFDPEGPGAYGPPLEHRIARALVRSWCDGAGFVVVDERSQTPDHYMLVAQRTP